MEFNEWLKTEESNTAKDMLEFNYGLQVLIVSIQDVMEFVWNTALTKNTYRKNDMDINDVPFKELYLGNCDVDKHIKEFMNNRFSDYSRGPNKYPTRMDICGCQLRIVHYGFSGKYMYYINDKTNGRKYQPTDYLIKKVIKDLKKTAEVKNGY